MTWTPVVWRDTCACIELEVVDRVGMVAAEERFAWRAFTYGRPSGIEHGHGTSHSLPRAMADAEECAVAVAKGER